MATPTPDSSFEEYRARRYFGSLDGLRALSIGVVILYHSSITRPLFPRLGFLGVDVFFEVSGFLIATLLLREKAVRGRIDIRKFYARRALRILPAYYFTVFALFAAYQLADHRTLPRWHDILWVYLIHGAAYLSHELPNLGMAWTLSAEEQFYAAWPWIEDRARHFWCWWTLLFAANLTVAMGLFDPLLHAIYGGPAPIFFACTFIPILLGVALAHLLHAPETHARLRRALGHRHAALLLTLGFFGYLGLAPDDIRGLFRVGAQLLMLAALGAAVLSPQSSMSPLLDHPWMVRIGQMSYGMYLWHMVTLAAARHAISVVGLGGPRLSSTLLVFAVGAPASYLFARLGERFIERPFAKAKRRFAAPRVSGHGWDGESD